jgi:hypothetical protein
MRKHLVSSDPPRRTATSYTVTHRTMLFIDSRSKGDRSFQARSSGSGLVSNLMPSRSSSFWGVSSRPLSSFVDAAAAAATRLESSALLGGSFLTFLLLLLLLLCLFSSFLGLLLLFRRQAYKDETSSCGKN